MEHEKKMKENQEEHNKNMKILQCQYEYDKWKQNREFNKAMMEQQNRYNYLYNYN